MYYKNNGVVFKLGKTEPSRLDMVLPRKPTFKTIVIYTKQLYYINYNIISLLIFVLLLAKGLDYKLKWDNSFFLSQIKSQFEDGT